MDGMYIIDKVIIIFTINYLLFLNSSLSIDVDLIFDLLTIIMGKVKGYDFVNN
jgi:hypothetical protein